MKLEEVLTQIFPDGFEIQRQQYNIVYGQGTSASGKVALIGTVDNALIGIRECTALGRLFLKVIDEMPGSPILMLVDNNGQRMALDEELLGLYEYIGNLQQIQDCARKAGHEVLALVYGNSIAGGFIACGLGADRVYALEDANTSVMNLRAIARVTKLPLEYLEELSKSEAVFAPGCENFFKMGGLHDIWRGDLNACLEKALTEHGADDNRVQLGAERGGRKEAIAIINEVVNG